MSFTALTTTETDAKSPLDDLLWKKVKDDFDDLDGRVISAGASPYVFELQGRFTYWSGRKRSICGGILNEDFTPQRVRYMLKKSGTAGTLAFDLRKHTSPKTPITAIASQYLANTTGIANIAGLATQSIARATPQIATQSISFAKASNAVQSIIGLGGNIWQYNLASTIDNDTLVGDSIVFASCTTGANNGTFTIVEINKGGGKNVTITNGSGVAQAGVAGTAQLQIMSYNYTNPVDTRFAATASVVMAAHTTGANNGTFVIYAINQAGNNIWVKNSTGVAQAGVAGTADTTLWKFAFSSAASTVDFVVGEYAHTSAHTNGLNNVGALKIFLVNDGGNNIILNNPAGVAQAATPGQVDTNRWKYTMPTDPTSQVSIGYGLSLLGHTTAANNGYFTAKEINHGGGNNVVIYNEAGVAQGGAAGTLFTTRKLVSFAADQSAAYTTASYIEMQGCADALYNYYWAYSPFAVVQVNRGGGSNYNVVIDVGSGNTLLAGEQVSPAGYVQTEMKSIFNTAPSLAVDLTGNDPNQNITGSSTDVLATVISAGTPVMLYLTSTPTNAEDLTVLLR